MAFILDPFIVEPPECGPVTVYTCHITMGSRTDLCSIDDGSTTAIFDSTTGNYQFSSTDMANYLPGTYVYKITGTIGSTSAYNSFSMTLVNPCPDSTLSLLPSPFVNQVAWRR